MIRFLGFKFGSMVDIMPHEANEMYDTQIQNELGFKVRKPAVDQHRETTTCLPALKAWQYSFILANGKIVQTVILPHVAKQTLLPSFRSVNRSRSVNFQWALYQEQELESLSLEQEQESKNVTPITSVLLRKKYNHCNLSYTCMCLELCNMLLGRPELEIIQDSWTFSCKSFKGNF